MAASEPGNSKALGQYVSRDIGIRLPRETLSTAIAGMIAMQLGVEPTNGDFRLYEHIDPEALDMLYEHARQREDASWRLEFAVGDETVVVRSDGFIRHKGSAGAAETDRRAASRRDG